MYENFGLDDERQGIPGVKVFERMSLETRYMNGCERVM
jgi:hypothetical protein